MKSMVQDIPDFSSDHAFECVGADASQAIRDIIKYIKPQGTLIT